MVSSARLCLRCKGRLLCGLKNCPLIARFNVGKSIQIKEDFFGPSTSVFVGRIGYPSVFVGPLASLPHASELDKLDNPSAWFGMDYSEVINMRSMLLRSKNKQSIFSRSTFIDDVQTLALANPTDIEMLFTKKPQLRISFSDIVQPMGPSASLKQLKIAENPKIPQKIEKIASDELKASQASSLLYKKGIDVYKISSILSSGALGLKKNKKLVPTRWSITSIDDIIAKNLLKQVRTYKSINDFRVFESQYLDNHFVILQMPGSWEFENFEAWAPGSMWAQRLKQPEIIEEYEPFAGRKRYADRQAGGYYASRIATIEALHKARRQARVIVFREVYEGYIIPMGVWVVREVARNAYKKAPRVFSSQKEALEYAGTRLRLKISEFVKNSRILQQKRLSDFWLVG